MDSKETITRKKDEWKRKLAIGITSNLPESLPEGFTGQTVQNWNQGGITTVDVKKIYN